MIASMMLTAILASLFFVVAAFLADRALFALGRATRAPWVIASLAAVAIPFGQLLVLLSLPEVMTSELGAVQALPAATILTNAALARFDSSAIAWLDRWLIVAWVAATIAIAVRLLAAHRALKRAALGWTRGEIEGVKTWLSENQGPALIGLREPELVVPRQMNVLPREQQRLAIAHELEHASSHDQWLVRAAALAQAAVPWNPLVWVATRRLRASIEIDCDARVLARLPNASAYASLVLDVASWPREASGSALALGETGVRALERRLRLMTTNRMSRQSVAALPLLTAALALAIYGCDVAINVQLPESRAASTLPNARSAAALTGAPYFEFQVDKPVVGAPGSSQPRYPNILRQAGVEGEVLAQFVVDAEGRADAATFKALKSSHDLFAQAVHAALPAMRFVPAEVGGKRVKQLVQQPFVFTIAR